MKIVAVIPARMGSTRFPGKPLMPILGLPMIEHVRRRTLLVKSLHEVWVATCDTEIRDVVERNGGKVIMTSDKHERATDRIEEAAHKIQADIYINVQGDEPMVNPGQIEGVVEPLVQDPSLGCSCLVYPVVDFADLQSLNVVKTVLSRSGKLLYLSRAAIPGKELDPSFKYYKQSGIMAFRKEFLHKYARLEPTPLEQKESVDMNRVLEHDYAIQGVIYPEETIGVDVPEQVAQVERTIMETPHHKALYEAIFK